jgi:hypothetical protein
MALKLADLQRRLRRPLQRSRPPASKVTAIVASAAVQLARIKAKRL